MDFSELVKQARSCRRFDAQKALPEGTLEWLVDCARITPSGKNAQEIRYALVEDKQACDKVFDALMWAGALKTWNGPEPHEHPAGYIICCASKNAGHMTPIDLGICAQTINLAAYTKGLAVCMFKSFDPATVAEVIDLPENMNILLPIAVGYPTEIRRLADVPENGKLMYWRDENQVHFVPKLALNSVIFRKI